MHIAFIEIQNFRKLKAVRVDFHEAKTLLVGPNNSGKTSAMVCLGHFLLNSKRFRLEDFTLSNWAVIDRVGKAWSEHDLSTGPLVAQVNDLVPGLPTLDIWLNVAKNEVHHVYHVLPTLGWAGGLLGVRLRFEPADIDVLAKDYILAYNQAKSVRQSASASPGGAQGAFVVWPQSLREFLERRLQAQFDVRAYALDATKLKDPVDGVASPQSLPADRDPIKGDPLKALIQVNEIGAQRGLGSAASLSSEADGKEDHSSAGQRRLSQQLRRYYADHLDPSEFPEVDDLKALSAIKVAQDQFDEKLKEGFASALQELQTLGYPGLMDPRLVVSTQLKPIDGLDHKAAVQYEVASNVGAAIASTMRLPEEYSGLGYQNLIYVAFQLMRFRDAWMQVGKAAKRAEQGEELGQAPLHLVLIEEPEAHLHAQVQQVFIREAYRILRNHEDLRDSTLLRTQLVVSTHSSHVTHETDFASLRYFRRCPCAAAGDVPSSTVVNLTTVFGSEEETPKFVMRYLTSMHSDLFFADAAIFVEGSAEGMLVPHFMRHRFRELRQRYVTVLEIGGSHAHRFRSLVECLGLTTLVVTDIDAVNAEGASVSPARGQNLVTANVTLKTWLPELSALDDLLDLPNEKKVRKGTELFSVRVAYQHPVKVSMTPGSEPVETIARTFEDALVFENLEFFRKTRESGPIGRFREVINQYPSPVDLGNEMLTILKKTTKAAFALDLLFSNEPGELVVPAYMHSGLSWLQEQLRKKDQDLLIVPAPSSQEGAQ